MMEKRLALHTSPFIWLGPMQKPEVTESARRAEEAYAESAMHAANMIDALRDILTEHRAPYDGKSYSWGDVADMNRICAVICTALDSLTED